MAGREIEREGRTDTQTNKYINGTHMKNAQVVDIKTELCDVMTTSMGTWNEDSNRGLD